MMRCSILLLATAALAGCDGSPPENPGAGTPTVGVTVPWDRDSIAGCDLVTEEELSATLGEPVVALEEGGEDWHGCRWETATNRLELLVFPDTSLPEGACQAGRSPAPHGQKAGGRLEEIPELGDAALWGSDGDLLVCTDRGLMAVHFDNSAATISADAMQTAAVRIAAIALTRL